jgi:predicted RNA binding protein YcfA (HicA-like mRNA interferase family)
MLLGTRKNYIIANSLLKKGFEEKHLSHTHLIFFIDGKKTSIFTFISHGKKEISDDLMHKMARQLKLSHKQFCELVDCSMNEEALREYYLDEGIVKL